MKPRLLVVSHPAVLPVNQLVYAELVERGWHVDLVVPDRWKHEFGKLVPAPLPALAGSFHCLPVMLTGRPQRHAYRRRVSCVLRDLRPDAVFLEQESFSLSALQWGLAAHRAGVPFGVQAAENLDRSLPRPVRAWQSWILRHATVVAARSDAATDLVRRWGARGEVELVPHHVPEWPVPRRLPSDDFRVGFAGRLVPEKGLDVLVCAVRTLGPGTELVVAGDGPLRAWLEGADLGVARLRLLTGVDHAEMASAYASMDVLVLPSRTTSAWAEQFGRVLVEALWCGVPVVGSDSGEIPWVIETTGGGGVVPEGDATALAAALAQLRDNPSERAALAAHGREVVARTFGVPAVADSLERLLAHAVPGILRRRPRVALVAHGVHDGGGMERACAELIRHSHEDVAFTVVACELAEELLPLVDRWVRVRVPMRPIPLKFVAFFVRAGLAVRRLNVDLVHTVGAIIPNRADLATVHFCHTGFCAVTGRLAPEGAPPLRLANSSLARGLAVGAERWCYRPPRLQLFATVSEGVAAEVARHYPNIPTAMTPNGVDVKRFRPDAHARQQMRADHGVHDQTCLAVFVGGDWDRKGLALAIEATATARTDGADVVLWVVGPGDELRFRELAAVLGVAEHVIFFGRRSETERFYQAADVFVLPTSYETFGIVCFEAAACGVPLVIPLVHGAGDLVRDGGAGIAVQRDASSVAAALATLARDPARRSARGAEARRRAAASTWEASAASVTDLYRSLAAEARG